MAINHARQDGFAWNVNDLSITGDLDLASPAYLTDNGPADEHNRV